MESLPLQMRCQNYTLLCFKRGGEDDLILRVYNLKGAIDFSTTLQPSELHDGIVSKLRLHSQFFSFSIDDYKRCLMEAIQELLLTGQVSEDLVPQDLLCPVTMALLDDPNILNCGHTFSLESIEGMQKSSPNCPTCRSRFSSKDFRPNFFAKTAVEDFKQKSTQVLKLGECKAENKAIATPLLTAAQSIIEQEPVLPKLYQVASDLYRQVFQHTNDRHVYKQNIPFFYHKSKEFDKEKTALLYSILYDLQGGDFTDVVSLFEHLKRVQQESGSSFIIDFLFIMLAGLRDDLLSSEKVLGLIQEAIPLMNTTVQKVAWYGFCMLRLKEAPSSLYQALAPLLESPFEKEQLSWHEALRALKAGDLERAAECCQGLPIRSMADAFLVWEALGPEKGAQRLEGIALERADLSEERKLRRDILEKILLPHKKDKRYYGCLLKILANEGEWDSIYTYMIELPDIYKSLQYAEGSWAMKVQVESYFAHESAVFASDLVRKLGRCYLKEGKLSELSILFENYQVLFLEDLHLSMAIVEAFLSLGQKEQVSSICHLIAEKIIESKNLENLATLFDKIKSSRAFSLCFKEEEKIKLQKLHSIRTLEVNIDKNQKDIAHVKEQLVQEGVVYGEQTFDVHPGAFDSILEDLDPISRLKAEMDNQISALEAVIEQQAVYKERLEWELFKAKHVFDAAKLSKVLKINIENEPPLPPNIFNIMMSDCPILRGRKIKDTHVLFLMPGGQELAKFMAILKIEATGLPDEEESVDQESHWVLLKKEGLTRYGVPTSIKECRKSVSGNYRLAPLHYVLMGAIASRILNNERLSPVEIRTYATFKSSSVLVSLSDQGGKLLACFSPNGQGVTPRAGTLVPIMFDFFL